MRLIDADKLIKKKQYLFKTESGAFPKSEWFIKADEIFNAPTIERPHGEWIDEGVYADYVGQHVYKCTYCNDHIIEFPTELGSYCKYCGSDNRKSGEAE